MNTYEIKILFKYPNLQNVQILFSSTVTIEISKIKN